MFCSLAFFVPRYATSFSADMVSPITLPAFWRTTIEYR